MLLKYKLNNVCDADHGPANGAQITKQFLYTTIYCGCQYERVDILHFLPLKKLIRIISVLNAYYGNHLRYGRIILYCIGKSNGRMPRVPERPLFLSGFYLLQRGHPCPLYRRRNHLPSDFRFFSIHQILAKGVDHPESVEDKGEQGHAHFRHDDAGIGKLTRPTAASNKDVWLYFLRRNRYT